MQYFKSFSKKRPITAQIAKEFWLPLVVSLSWASLDLWLSLGSHANSDVQLTSGDHLIEWLKDFFTAFFFVSWFAGQYNRIVKQKKVESKLDTVTNDLNTLLIEFKKQFEHLIGYTTGGEGIPFLTAVVKNDMGNSPEASKKQYVLFNIHNTDVYPIYDINIFGWISGPVEGTAQSSSQRILQIAKLEPSLIPTVGDAIFSISDTDNRLKFSFLITTKTVSVTQTLILVKRVGLKFHQASKLVIRIKGKRGTVTTSYQVPEDFPGYNPGVPEELFEEVAVLHGSGKVV